MTASTQAPEITAAIRTGNFSSPKGQLLKGHLPSLLADPLGFVSECAREHGDLVPLRFGPKPAVLISHPALIEQVLLRASDDFAKPFAVRGDRLGAAHDPRGADDVWRRPQLAQTVFHRSCAHAYGTVMNDLIQRELDAWRPGEIRDFAEDMNRLAFDIAARTLFGADARDLAAIVADVLPVVMSGFLDRAKTLFLIPQRLPTIGNRRLNRAMQRLDDVVEHVLAAGGPKEDGTGGLLRLIADAEAAGATLDPARIRSEALTFLLAGYETVATSLAWAWLLLAQHPDVAEELAAEIDGALDGRPPTAADVERLPLTRSVVREALRLYPPIWLITRTARHDCLLGGYAVRKGTFVLTSPWVVHRDPRSFEHPDQFLPHRWDGAQANRLPKFAYFPFGGGRRGCIGSDFAMLEATLVLASTMQRFHPTLASAAQEIDPQVSVTLRPRGGVKVVIRPREQRVLACPQAHRSEERAAVCPVSGRSFATAP